MDQDDVAVGFDIVLEEIENAVAVLDAEAIHAIEAGKRDAARDLAERGLQVTAFAAKVSELRQEWLGILAAFVPAKAPRKTRRSRRVTERLEKGLRTPEDAFQVPILQSLVDLGGAAPMASVVDKLEQRMGTRLNKYDLQPLISDPDQPRWRNTAQWARSAMVRQGLLSEDSPRGTWEITPAGRKLLATASKG